MIWTLPLKKNLPCQDGRLIWLFHFYWCA